MTFSDYLLDIALIAIVFRQIRESRFDLKMMLLPLIICGIVASQYLHGIPTASNDLILVVTFTAFGALCGLVSALATRIRRNAEGHVLIKAGWVAAGTWVLSMGFRLGFGIWASHGGAVSLARFSSAHHITSGDAWTAALVLMAIGEVVVRTGLLWLRASRTGPAGSEAAKALTAA
jgi:hypothetical protein